MNGDAKEVEDKLWAKCNKLLLLTLFMHAKQIDLTQF